jgi:coproporphyrinogen III oxidase-like Fe-S oxidoreductase
LLALSETGIRVQPRGRLLIRNIGMNFDAYLVAKKRAEELLPRHL